MIESNNFMALDLPDFENVKKWYRLFQKLPRWVHIIIFLVLSVSLFFILYFKLHNPNNRQSPKFLVTNPHIRVQSDIIIEAENRSANLSRPLKMKYDEVVLKDAATPIPDTNPQRWRLTLYDKDLPTEMLGEGAHHVCFAFTGEDFSALSIIIISKKSFVPVIEVNESNLPTITRAEISKIEAHNPTEFINALKPNTIIKLENAVYNLSEVKRTENEYIKWVDVHDGQELVIHSISNLTIVGETGTTILIRPAYAWVMNFQNSKNIKIQNITLGHISSGYCTGGVLSFISSEDIEIVNSVLFGSGTTGMQIDRVNHLKFVDSTIKNCTYDLLSICNSTNILFDGSTFENSGEFNLITISDASCSIKFNKCLIQNNKTNSPVFYPYLFFLEGETFDISLINSKIINNNVYEFVNYPDKLFMQNNEVLYNRWQGLNDGKFYR